MILPSLHGNEPVEGTSDTNGTSGMDQTGYEGGEADEHYETNQHQIMPEEKRLNSGDETNGIVQENKHNNSHRSSGEQSCGSVEQECLRIAEEVVREALHREQARRQSRDNVMSAYEKFCGAYGDLVLNKDLEEQIRFYLQCLVQYAEHEIFFQHFVEHQYLAVLMNKVREMKYSSEMVRTLFWGLEYLLKGLSADEKSAHTRKVIKEEQFIYCLIMINKEGFLTENYQFQETEDWAYFAHLIKLLLRIMNPDPGSSMSSRHSPDNSKYLSIFFNSSQPQFPILLKILKMYRNPDTILQTSVKLCLLEIANHPDTNLQKYLSNFPFLIFYLLYCSKINEDLQTIMSQHICKRRPFALQEVTFKEQILTEKIISDIKFLEDYLSQNRDNPYAGFNVSVFCNVFFYYIGRIFHHYLSKFITHVQRSEQEPEGGSYWYGFVNSLVLINSIVIRMTSVYRIKLGFDQMLHKFVYVKYHDYLASYRKKCAKLQSDRYWMFDDCAQDIRQHAYEVIFAQEKMRDSVTLDPGQQKSEEPPGNLNSFRSIPNPHYSQSTHLPVSVQNTKKSESSTTRMSLLRTVNSYIPRSWSGWLRGELATVSQATGYRVELRQQIDPFDTEFHKQYSKCSFTTLIDQIQQFYYDNKRVVISSTQQSMISRHQSPVKQNPLFCAVVKPSPFYKSKNGLREGNREQMLYYYIATLITLTNPRENTKSMQKIEPKVQTVSHHNIEEMTDILMVCKSCISLMLVGAVYFYVQLIDFEIAHSALSGSLQSGNGSDSTEERLLLGMYLQTMEKVVYWILTEGWAPFLGRIRAIKQAIWKPGSNCFRIPNDDHQPRADQLPYERDIFKGDLFRDIECDILLFIMLRRIFGTRNDQQNTDMGIEEALNTDHHMHCQLSEKDIISKQIKTSCQFSEESEQIYITLDGQYIKFTTMEDVCINEEPLTVGCLNIYMDECEDQRAFELVHKDLNRGGYTVLFKDQTIRNYMGKEIKWRKRAITEIELLLRTMRFDIQGAN